MIEELRICLSEIDLSRLNAGHCTTADIWSMASDENVRSRFSYAVAKAGTIGFWAGPTGVPAQIVQFWDSEAIPADVHPLMTEWTREEPSFAYTRFSDTTARAFIAAHYEQKHLEAYDHCHHPAMRSDYFRLAYLAQKGGLYIDADDARVANGLSDLISDPASLQLQLLVWQEAAGGKGGGRCRSMSTGGPIFRRSGNIISPTHL